jgi:sn-glycerol 3-phosphate transport system permease protein
VDRRVVFSGWLFPAVLLLPQLAVTVVFFFWPAGQAIVQSVQGGDAFGLTTRFVGWENFATVFADPNYIFSFGVTAFFSVAVAILALAPGLLLAVMADRVVKGAAILAAAWKQISYNFLFFLAGLQAIPASLLEASAIDGATPRRRFWTIVFPLLAPTSFFLIVVNIVYAFFDTFGVIHNVTQGGPDKATEILVYKVWYDGIVGLDLGGSAAQSVVLMAIVIGLTAIQFRFIERRVHYA